MGSTATLAYDVVDRTYAGTERPYIQSLDEWVMPLAREVLTIARYYKRYGYSREDCLRSVQDQLASMGYTAHLI